MCISAGEGSLLGHVVSKEGVSVDPRQIEAVTQWPRPKNVTKVPRVSELAPKVHTKCF